MPLYYIQRGLGCILLLLLLLGHITHELMLPLLDRFGLICVSRVNIVVLSLLILCQKSNILILYIRELFICTLFRQRLYNSICWTNLCELLGLVQLASCVIYQTIDFELVVLVFPSSNFHWLSWPLSTQIKGARNLWNLLFENT